MQTLRGRVRHELHIAERTSARQESVGRALAARGAASADTVDADEMRTDNRVNRRLGPKIAVASRRLVRGGRDAAWEGLARPVTDGRVDQSRGDWAPRFRTECPSRRVYFYRESCARGTSLNSTGADPPRWLAKFAVASVRTMRCDAGHNQTRRDVSLP